MQWGSIRCRSPTSGWRTRIVLASGIRAISRSSVIAMPRARTGSSTLARTWCASAAAFFHTPLVKGFILASEAYHDLYRWPFIDRRIFERWCENTEWGQLFLRYAKDRPQGGLSGDIGPAGLREAIASKQIYGTHYFDASLGLTVLVRDRSVSSPAMYLVYLNRSRVDIFDGAARWHRADDCHHAGTLPGCHATRTTAAINGASVCAASA